MKIAFNPSTVAALTSPPDNKNITFDLRGHNIFARGVKFQGTDTNTWRDIKINNVSIGSYTLDLRNGSNTTLTNTNGVVTINSTWRPVVDNLTSNSTTSSLSANQGRVLAGLINGKSNSDHNHDNRYVKRSGDTMLGALNFANGTWNLVGDDSYIGDCNVWGHLGIKAATTTYPGVAFFNNANTFLGNLTAYSGNIKYGTYSLQFLDNGNTSVSASDWINPYSAYNSNAVADGQAICVWGQCAYLGNLSADTGGMSLWLKRVNARLATLSMVLDGEYYARGTQRLAHASEIPTSLKNPQLLTLKANGTTLAIYDGSSAKEANFTYANVGAASASHTHNYYAVSEYYRVFKKAERLPTSGFYQSNESESGGNAPWRSWMHLINCQHTNINNNYALQIAASFYDNNTFKIRVTNDSVNTAWRNIIHSGNINFQSVASASKLQTARNIWGQSFDGTTNVDNTLRIRKTTGNYCEGIRIQTSDGAQSTIILGATSDSGTNTNAWSIHRKSDNNFAISRNSSDGTNGLVMTSVGMGLGTTSPTQRLDVNGNIRTTGNLYISHATNNNMNHDTSNPRIVFSESGGQAVGLVYTDYDSYRASKGLKVMDVDNNDPSNVWFEVQGYNYSRGYVKNGSNDNYVLLGGGGHKAESSLRVSYASNADMVDGEHASNFVRAGVGEWSDLNSLKTYSFIQSICSTISNTSPNGNTGWYNVIQAVYKNGANDGPNFIGQIALGMTTNINGMFYRTKYKGSWYAWNEVVTTNTGLLRYSRNNVNISSPNCSPIPPSLLEWTIGYPRLYDPEFNEGYNNVNVYNNAGNGVVTVTRVHDTNVGNSSNYVMKVVSAAGAIPNYGGWLVATQTELGKVYTCLFRASIPSGIEIEWNSNSIGTGGQMSWLTNNMGTGKWTWYAVQVYCGSGGSTTFFFSAKSPCTWCLSYVNVIENNRASYAGLRSVYSDYLKANASIVFGRNELQYFNQYTDVTAGATSNANPKTAWHHILRMNHANNNGFFVDLAIPFFDNRIQFRRITNGTDNGWRRIITEEPNHNVLLCDTGTGGNVGIANPNPSQKLDVNGHTLASGFIHRYHQSDDAVLLAGGSYKTLNSIYGGDNNHPVFLGYLNLDHGNDGTIRSSFSCLGYSVPFTYTRGGNYCKITIPDTIHQTFYIQAATASVNYSGGGMDTWVGNHRGSGAWWLHCYASSTNEVRVKGFRQSNGDNDSWWGGNPLWSYNDGANKITVCIFGYVKFL